MTTSTNPQILFIDDEPTIVEAAQKLLSQEGFEVFTFRSPAEVLPAIEEKKFQLSCLVVDWELPETTGGKLVEDLSQQLGKIPVVFISGYDLSPSLIESCEHPVALMKKPFRFSHLAQIINMLIAQGNDTP